MNTNNWLEVSLIVNGELAEAVADVLGRFAPNGVMTEQGVNYLHDEDPGTPAGPVTVRAYLEVNDQLEAQRRKLGEALYFLGMIQPLPEAQYRFIQDQNWMEAWKEHYHPIAIGKRLLIVPAWVEPAQQGRVAIKIDPGMAFGTGTHPSTQLCLEWIEEYFAKRPTYKDEKSRRQVGESSGFLDIGCGSGILSIAALKLGAETSLAVDIDPGSLANARENAALNQIGDELILGVGSVGDILDGKFPYRKAPVVAANILAPVLLRLFENGLADTVEEGGTLILGGILEGQAESIQETARAHGFKTSKIKKMADWVAFSCQKVE
jgi:ribosomal protein L11 methyltransferase